MTDDPDERPAQDEPDHAPGPSRPGWSLPRIDLTPSERRMLDDIPRMQEILREQARRDLIPQRVVDQMREQINRRIDLTRSVRHMFGDISRTQEMLREQARRDLIPQRVVDQMREQINRHLQTLIEPAREFAARMAQQFEEAMPANWREIDAAQFSTVMDYCEAGPVAVVWVPRSEVVVKLAEAESHAARDQILIDHRDQILDDVANALLEATVNPTGAQEEARSQALEAISAARAGFDRAAQTLLASALGHVLEGALGFEQPGKAHKRFKERELDDATLTELRVVCLQLSTVNALTDTKFEPEGFNRHGTQHGSPAHLSEAAMLGAALLVTGWIRELSWLSEHRPELIKDDSSAA